DYRPDRPGRTGTGRCRRLAGTARNHCAGRSMNLGDRTMTVTNAKRLRLVRALPSRAGVAGFVAGMLAAFGSVQAAPLPAAQAAPAVAQAAPVNSLDPGRRLPGTISVADIDFNPGDGGADRKSVGEGKGIRLR